MRKGVRVEGRKKWSKIIREKGRKKEKKEEEKEERKEDRKNERGDGRKW